jgi:hypothetical protein
MDWNLPSFPDLSSFGTVLGFAQALEASALSASRELAAQAGSEGARERLEDCARRHDKRARQLDRLRRERLNEVVLQPIAGMNREDYLPPEAWPEADTLGALVEVEGRAERFYRDAAVVAANVLGGLPRTFEKMAEECRDMADRLRAS